MHSPNSTVKFRMLQTKPKGKNVEDSLEEMEWESQGSKGDGAGS